MTAFVASWMDRFSNAYGRQPLSEISWFTAAPGIELMKLVIDGTLRRGFRLVDVGCGPGVDAVFLARHGLRVTGVDQSEAALERARAWAGLSGVEVEFLEGDVLDVPLASGCADVVTDSFVFHNLCDDARAPYANEVHRLLRPGGLFVINAFSDEMSPGTGPRRLSAADILGAFAEPRFRCRRLAPYRNLPTEAKPLQVHWFGVFERAGHSEPGGRGG